MMKELEAIRAVDFDWTMRLRNVWVDPPCDVPSLHAELREDFVQVLEMLNASDGPDAPLGWPVVGAGGCGKTHLLSVLCREALTRHIGFVLVDMTDVHDFWANVLLGYTSSLQQELQKDRFQFQVLLERFLENLGHPGKKYLAQLKSFSKEKLAFNIPLVVSLLQKHHPQAMARYQDVIRALLCLNSSSIDVVSIGLTWLQGCPIEEADKSKMGFTKACEKPIEIIRALSWLMNLAGPTILAFDQLDPIVTQMHIAADIAPDEPITEEVRVAKSIINGIASGLGALPDITVRTFTVLSCLETTWSKLFESAALKTYRARYDEERFLRPLPNGEVAQSIILARLERGYQRVQFQPPYPTWPFAPEAFQGLQGLSPRQVLQIANQFRTVWLRNRHVEEVKDFKLGPSKGSVSPKPKFEGLDGKFQAYRQEADLAWLMEQASEDERLAPLLHTACRCVIKECKLPAGVFAELEVDLQGGKTTRALHARIRVIHGDEADREEHFCMRALERANATAFQARLDAAVTQAGIDPNLSFRHLLIMRRNDLPSGKVTSERIAAFKKAGGLFYNPTDDELRTLWALRKLELENDPLFADWVADRRPASKLDLMKHAVGKLCAEVAPSGATPAPTPAAETKKPALLQSPAPPPPGPATKSKAAPPPVTKPGAQPGASTTVPPIPPTATAAAKPAAPTPKKPAPPSAPSPATDIIMGWKLVGDTRTDPIELPVVRLQEHTSVWGTSGSGKTVLLRRLIEEAVLKGIPSVVVDVGNDLPTLGDPWPETPHPDWFGDCAAKAPLYFETAQVILWTPGREAGNPLHLEPLPDLAAVSDDHDALTAAVTMACDALMPIAAPGASMTVPLKKAILNSALRYLATHHGGKLADLVALLSDLPHEAGPGVQKQTKLAADMADLLKAAMQTNPLLHAQGTPLDPYVLFGENALPGKVRVSVINLSGLTSLESKRLFVNQLAMTLFSWIQKNPSPSGRPLRGLLCLDEARDFVPSQVATPCKSSIMQLTVQARKYHLGLVFATQNPKDIENKLVSNCSTLYFGRASSPVAIETVKEQIKERGGSGNDVAQLTSGKFYFFNVSLKTPPCKVQVPVCLSHHRKDAMEPQEIVERAKKSRAELGL